MFDDEDVGFDGIDHYHVYLQFQSMVGCSVHQPPSISAANIADPTHAPDCTNCGSENTSYAFVGVSGDAFVRCWDCSRVIGYVDGDEYVPSGSDNHSPHELVSPNAAYIVYEGSFAVGTITDQGDGAFHVSLPKDNFEAVIPSPQIWAIEAGYTLAKRS